MAHPVFNRETLLDSLVNVIPLVMILFFLVLYLLTEPWSEGISLNWVMMVGLHAVPFVSLALLTYLAAQRL